MWSPIVLLGLVGLASVFADYAAPAADPGYGSAAAAPVQVVPVPIASPPEFNQPGFTNVLGGFRHGPFFDGLIDNHHRHRHRHHGRRHHGHHHHRGFFPGFPGYFPGYGGGYGYQEELSNPFFVPDHHRHRHHGRRRHHKRRDSHSGSDSDSDSDSNSNSDSDNHSGRRGRRGRGNRSD